MIRTLSWSHPRHGDVEVSVRKPEPGDLEALYQQKNDPEVADRLGGFTSGYARADLGEWIDRHRKHQREVLWAITSGGPDGPCIGHVGLYEIDHRIRSAEFAIMIGDRGHWGRGIGKNLTAFAVRYGFEMLNLNRIELSVLANNESAHDLYRKLGFRDEGVRRQAQFKNGDYVDVVVMGLLRDEWSNAP